MHNSIQHFLEYGTKKIEKNIKNLITNGESFGEFVLNLEEVLHELGRTICKEVLEDIDKDIKADKDRKRDWEVKRKDETGTITTIFGKVEYNRTYYKSKENGIYRHLVDEFAGIKQHERLSEDVIIRALEEATDSSYSNTGKKVILTEELSKQTIMNMIKDVDEIKYKPDSQKEKRNVKILYIEADEDHVSLQSGGTVMPRLVYVHEGIEKIGKTRNKLKNTRYFGGIYQETEELWLEVAQYIDDTYDIENIEKIYLAGDGAPWIRQGLGWIINSKFVLDKYHLKKYILKATGHIPELRQELKDALDEADKNMLKEVFKKILSVTNEETKKESVKVARRYMLNNWDGIEIYETDGYDVVGCSAEGHVSHILSDRLSSRPMGWSKICADRMTRLRVYRENGGKIIDLVLEKSKRKEKENEEVLAKEIKEKIRKRTDKRYSDNEYYNCSSLLDTGKTTALYKGFKGIINNEIA